MGSYHLLDTAHLEVLEETRVRHAGRGNTGCGIVGLGSGNRHEGSDGGKGATRGAGFLKLGDQTA